MEQAGLIASYWGDGVGGARRRYYSITQKGLATYKEHVAEWQEVNTILNSLITGDLT